MYSKKTKTITKRALKNRTDLFISDQGDISDLETTIWRGSRKARRWVQVAVRQHGRSLFGLITGADAVKLDKNDLLVTTGSRVDRIPGTRFDEPHPAMRQPEGRSTTIDGWRAENHAAMKTLQAAAGTDRTLPILTGVVIEPHGSNTVCGWSSDRFLAAQGILETTSKPIDFEAIVPGVIVRELAVAAAWHLTVWETASVAELCDTGLRVQHGNLEGDFPRVKQFFTEDLGDDWASMTVEPLAFARSLRRLNTSNSFPAGLSADGLLAADGSGAFKPTGLIEAQSKGQPRQWVQFRSSYLARLLQAVGDRDRAQVNWISDGSEKVKPLMVESSDRVRGLLMTVRGPGDSFPVADEVDLL